MKEDITLSELKYYQNNINAWIQGWKSELPEMNVAQVVLQLRDATICGKELSEQRKKELAELSEEAEKLRTAMAEYRLKVDTEVMEEEGDHRSREEILREAKQKYAEEFRTVVAEAIVLLENFRIFLNKLITDYVCGQSSS